MTKLISSDDLLNILSTCTSTPTTFNGLPGEDLRWLEDIERCSRERGIPKKQWADVALYFIKGDLKTVMEDRRRHLTLFGVDEWDWEDFKHELTSFCEKTKKLTSPGIILEAPSLWEAPPIFDRHPFDTYVNEWLESIQNGCQERKIPENKWPDVATYFLTDELRQVMNERKQHLMLFGVSEWQWEDFKQELCSICEDASMFFRPEKLISLVDAWNPSPMYTSIPGEVPVLSWLREIEQACEADAIPSKQWTDVAIHLLQGDMKTIMEERKKELSILGSSEWPWDKFKKEFTSFCGIFTKILDKWVDPPMFGGQLAENPHVWLDTVAKCCLDRQIPEMRYADVAIYFTTGDLRVVMEERKAATMRAGSPEWRWEDFKKDFLCAHGLGRKGLFLAILHSWGDPPICGLVTDNYAPWLQEVERGCQDRSIPEDLLPDTAIYFLRGELKVAMEERKAALETPGWNWDVFQQELLRYSHDTLTKRRRDYPPELKRSPQSNRTEAGDYSLVTAAAGINALTSGESLPAVVFAVTNMSSWFRRSKSRR